MKERILENMVKLFIVIIGVGVTILSIYLIKSANSFRNNAILTTAIVEDVRKVTDSNDNIKYEVKLAYKVNNIRYYEIITISSYIREYDKIDVYYNPNNPEEIKLSKYDFTGFVVLALGIIFTFIGIYLLFYQLINKVRLLNSGAQIIAKFKSVEIDRSTKISDKYPYNIVCEGEDFITGKVRTFNSYHIWENPKKTIKEKNITAFPVYIDRKNPKKYYVSLDALKNKTTNN